MVGYSGRYASSRCGRRRGSSLLRPSSSWRYPWSGVGMPGDDPGDEPDTFGREVVEDTVDLEVRGFSSGVNEILNPNPNIQDSEVTVPNLLS